MAYIPTEWETGDVITAAKLNNMEQGIEDAFVAPAVTIADEGDVLTVNSSGEWAAAAPASPLPEVAAADQGKVLTVDSSGEWAAAEDKDLYILKGTVVVDQDLAFVSFTLDEGDPTDIDGYKMAYMQVSLKMGTTTIMVANVPYDRNPRFNTTTMQPLNNKCFTALIPTILSPGVYQIFTYVVIAYDSTTSTWECTLERIKLDFMS